MSLGQDFGKLPLVQEPEEDSHFYQDCRPVEVIKVVCAIQHYSIFKINIEIICYFCHFLPA